MLVNLLAALTAVLLVGRAMGRLFRAIGQPPVIGEVVGGILLGPSLLGYFAPGLYGFLLPASVVPSLELVAQLGVVLYMFLVGVELNPDAIRGRLRSTIGISVSGMVVPFVLGSLLALVLYPRFAPDGVALPGFLLFIGVAMSITAFPVLARILADHGMTKTRLGSVALACAALGDVIAWCLLAFVVGVVQTTAPDALSVAMLTVLFIAAVFVVVRPIMVRWVRALDERGADRGGLAMALIAMLAGALTTEAIGIHAIFGAFLIGAVIPHDSRLARELERSIGGLVSTLLLPAFFAFAGMRTEIGLLSSGYEWAVCALIVLVATAGKLGGVAVAARVSGYRWSDALGLGVLMNTRGLMELIVLNVGLDLGVISPTLFAMLVVMALATTMAASPLLRMMQGPAWHDVAAETSTAAASARVGDPRAS